MNKHCSASLTIDEFIREIDNFCPSDEENDDLMVRATDQTNHAVVKRNRPSFLPPSLTAEWSSLAAEIRQYWLQLLLLVSALMAISSALIYYDYQQEREIRTVRLSYHRCLNTLQSWSLGSSDLAQLGIPLAGSPSKDLQELQERSQSCQARMRELAAFMPDHPNRAWAVSKYLEHLQQRPTVTLAPSQQS